MAGLDSWRLLFCEGVAGVFLLSRLFIRSPGLELEFGVSFALPGSPLFVSGLVSRDEPLPPLLPGVEPEVDGAFRESVLEPLPVSVLRLSFAGEVPWDLGSFTSPPVLGAFRSEPCKALAFSFRMIRGSSGLEGAILPPITAPSYELPTERGGRVGPVSPPADAMLPRGP